MYEQSTKSRYNYLGQVILNNEWDFPSPVQSCRVTCKDHRSLLTEKSRQKLDELLPKMEFLLFLGRRRKSGCLIEFRNEQPGFFSARDADGGSKNGCDPTTF
uniref:Uncharacterized protein n=1 Tax=Mucochytrium quahogii TaxID=96639 RepID=A0A7S2SRA5_9STRA|mmetsp:Transcript_6151/g.10532  ORF Transcript_6151/g.10532 Transcript_6151/m.10532 type:complete len:102 (+) Transcript_6151:489-794(+)